MNPALLTASGENCLGRVAFVASLGLPPAHIATSLVTAVEVHVSRVLVRLIDLSAVTDIPFGLAMVKELSESFERTWSSRLDWMSNGFSVQLSGTAEQQAFDRVVQVRNAVVHGDSRLTPRQTKSLAAALKLRKELEAHLDVSAIGVLAFGPMAVSRMVVAVRTFVVAFDEQVILHYPKARLG